MQAYQPDRVVKVLSGLVTGAYYLVWVLAVLGLAAIPLAKVVGADRPGAFFRIEAPVTVHPALDLGERWRIEGARVEVSRVQATASVPMASAPVGFLALVWVALAAWAGLILLFLYHLRRLFQRVREGAPFDPVNASRLRWVGVLLLASVLWKAMTDLWTSLTISRMLEGPGDRLGTGVELNLPVILVALVLIALAEIFRRGAALEDEQALVV